MYTVKLIFSHIFCQMCNKIVYSYQTFTCACAFLDIALKTAPNNVPTAMTEGTHKSVTKVIWGEISTSDIALPIICVAALNPPETVCLKLLLNSWISVVNLKGITTWIF